MSEVLDYVREKDPRFKDIGDDELTLYLADKKPDFLKDKDFTAQFQGVVAKKGLEAVQQGVSGFLRVLTNPAAGEAAQSGREDEAFQQAVQPETVPRTGEERAARDYAMAPWQRGTAVRPFTEPRLKLPTAEITDKDHPIVAIGKEAYNIAKGVPEFFTSDAGALGAIGGATAPAITAAAFTVDMFRSLGQQIVSNYKNWDKMSPNQKWAAVTDVAGTGTFGLFLGKSAYRGFKPKVEPTPGVEPGKPAPLATPTRTELVRESMWSWLSDNQKTDWNKLSATEKQRAAFLGVNGRNFETTVARAKVDTAGPAGKGVSTPQALPTPSTQADKQLEAAAVQAAPVAPMTAAAVQAQPDILGSEKPSITVQEAPKAPEIPLAPEKPAATPAAEAAKPPESEADLRAQMAEDASGQGMEVAPEGFYEQITAASYTHPDTGETTTGENHIEAAAKQGVPAPRKPTDRQTPEYGFEVHDPQTGEKRYVTRGEAELIARANGQLLEEPKTGQLHSDEVKFYKPKEQNAIQEQSANEEVLREQGPELGLPQVGARDAELEKPAATQEPGAPTEQAAEKGVGPAELAVSKIRTQWGISEEQAKEALASPNSEAFVRQLLESKGYKQGKDMHEENFLQAVYEGGRFLDELKQSQEAPKLELPKRPELLVKKGMPKEEVGAAFKQDRENWEKYQEDLKTFEAAYPQNKAILLKDPKTDHYRAITKDPQGGWRSTSFTQLYRDDQRLAPWGHERFETRYQALKENASGMELADKLPEIIAEDEIRTKRVQAERDRIKEQFEKALSTESISPDKTSGVNVYSDDRGIHSIGNPQDIFSGGVAPSGLKVSTVGVNGMTGELRLDRSVWGEGVDRARIIQQLKDAGLKEEGQITTGQLPQIAEAAKEAPAPSDVPSPEQSAPTAETEAKVAEEKPKDKARVGRGVTAGKKFQAETDLNGPDILSWIHENMKLLSKSAAKAKWGKEKFTQNASMWDDAVKLERPHHNIIYSDKGTPPDRVAQAAFEAGVISEPTPSALWDAIDKGSKARSKAFATAKREEAFMAEEVQQHQDWLKATAEGEERIAADQLKKGDQFEVDGEKVEVTDVDADGNVTLKDGRKFGIQKLEDGQSIHVEKFEPAEEGEVDFGPGGEVKEPEHEASAEPKALPVGEAEEPGPTTRSGSPAPKGEEGARETGKTGYSKTLYQGRGASLEDIYGPEAVKAGRAAPILGKAEYYATNPEDAKIYGTVSQAKVELQNPFTIDSDAGWHQLLEAANATVLDSRGREWYEHPERIPAAGEKVQRYLKSQGYDGVIVKLPEFGDVNERGERIKGLVESFGHEQVVKFNKEAPKTAVEERPLTKPEQDEFQALSIKARRARDLGEENLTTEETKRYNELTAMAGQFDLLAEDQPSGVQSRIKQLREKADELDRLRVRTQERAFDSRHRREELFKEARAYDTEAKKARSEASDLERHLPMEEEKPKASEHYQGPGDINPPKFETGAKVIAGEGAAAREGEIAGTGPKRPGEEQTYFVKTNLGETLYNESQLKQVATKEEYEAFQKSKAEPELPKSEQKFRLKNEGPQTYTVVERLPASQVEIENGEQAIRVKNERTGEESTVLESQLQAVKERTTEEREASKGMTKREVDDELRRLKLDPSSFTTMAEKKAAIRRAKLAGPGTPSLYQGPDPKEQIEQLTEAFQNLKGRKVPLKEKVKEEFAGTVKAAGAVKDLMETAIQTPGSPQTKLKAVYNAGKAMAKNNDPVSRALAGLKASGDYIIAKWKGYNTLDDMLRAKGELSAEVEKRGWRVRQFVTTVEKAIPDKKQRAAIAKWVDAGGDQNELHWGMMQTHPDFRQAYADAMNLTGDARVAAENIRSFFESRLQEAIDAGVLDHGVDDYIHRIYEKDPKIAQRVAGYVQSGILSKNPALAKKRFFQMDWEAERLGYKPVQDFLPRLTTYETSLSRAIAAREFIRKMVGFTDAEGNKIKGMLAPDGRPVVDVAGLGIPIEDQAGVRETTLINPSFKPEDTRNPLNNRTDYKERPEYSALRKWKWASTDAAGQPIYVQGNVLIHKDYVGRIDALLKPSQLRYSENAIIRNVSRAAMGASSTVKQTMLDFSGFHQVQIAVHALEHKVQPAKLQIPYTNLKVNLPRVNLPGLRFAKVLEKEAIDFSDPNVDGLMKGGLTMGGEYREAHQGEGLVGRSVSRLIPGLGSVMETYHNYLFQEFIPRVKMTMALHALEKNKARFAHELASGRMTMDEIHLLTANQANAAFGGLNYTMLERSKTAQDISRMIMMAPDFLEARGRFATQAFTKHGREQLVALTLGAITMYSFARIMNQLIDGQPHMEPENAFSIIYKNKAYSLRTVQGDILHLIEHPTQFWLSRLNPVYTRPFLEMASGRDYFGRKRNAMEQAWDAVSTVMPISLRSSSERKLWESMANGLGVTARRYSDADTAFKMAEKWKEKNKIITTPGEFIYDSNKDPLRPLKLALSNSDDGASVKEIKKLLEGDSKYNTQAALSTYFDTYANKKFTGSAKHEDEFIASLSADEKKTVEAGRQHKLAMKALFLSALAKYLSALKAPAPEVMDESGLPVVPDEPAAAAQP